MFFIIVLTVNLVVNLYLFFRTRPLFPAGTTMWWLAAIVFWVLAFSYVIGRFLERADNGNLAQPFIVTGSWWMGAMVYLTLLFLLIDLVRGLNGLFNATELFRFSWYDIKGKTAIILTYSITAIILLIGNYNARMPVTRNVAIHLEKEVPGGSQKVVLVSDLHLGMMISNGKLTKMVDLINREKADIVLLAGDVFDEDLGPVIKNNMGDLLKEIKAKHGVFAVLGNHEFYGNAEAAQKYLQDHRIIVLRDSVAILENGIIIAGREDLTYERMSNNTRKPVKELLAGVNNSLPIFLMDHQPMNLQEAANSPVDLQVSGHTHNGQMWPFNYITDAIFEVGKGYEKINSTHFYVSSGYGTWGPPMRTNSRSEIIVFNITNSNS